MHNNASCWIVFWQKNLLYNSKFHVHVLAFWMSLVTYANHPFADFVRQVDIVPSYECANSVCVSLPRAGQGYRNCLFPANIIAHHPVQGENARNIQIPVLWLSKTKPGSFNKTVGFLSGYREDLNFHILTNSYLWKHINSPDGEINEWVRFIHLLYASVNRVSIGSDNSLSSIQRQVII